MSPKWLIPIGATILIAASAIVWTHRATPSPTSAPAASAPAEVLLTGPIEPRNIVSVQPSSEGILDTWAVEVGQNVYKDQLLARIRVIKLEEAVQQSQADLDHLRSRVDTLDAARIAAKLEISRAEAEKSRADSEAERLKKIYDRYKGLWDLGAIARLDFEKSEKDYKGAQTAAENAGTALEAAKKRSDIITDESESLSREIAGKTEALEQANADLTSGDLHSPADGIVTARRGDPGQPVDPSMRDLIQIATDLTQLQVAVTPSPGDLARIHAGEAAAVRVEAGEFQGTVREIRGEQVVVDFNASAAVAKIGGSAQVRIKF